MADVWLWVNKRTDDALAFFERLKVGLRPDGVIIIKENVCASGFVVDKVWHTTFSRFMLQAPFWNRLSSFSSKACSQRRFYDCGVN